MSIHHLATALALVVCAPAGRAIVAEVYYDAPGDDTGHEFVELYNPLGHACALLGMKLEAGDGSGPGRWTLKWTGGAVDSVPAHGRFVVGGALVVPAPDRVVTLDLQNGPDALRVTWPDGAQEVVGWGAQEFAEYACGASGPDVASGSSLARVPDDADFGSNALDFRAREPSPGRANELARDAAIVRATLAVTPEQPEPGEALLVALRLSNTGRQPLADGEARLVLAGDAALDTLESAVPALAPGESLLVTRAVTAGEPGRRQLRARVALAGDEQGANDADTLALRVGAGPLEVTEIQFHPAAGEGEWVEVRNRSGTPLPLAGFTLSDRGTSAGQVAGATVLAPESLAVLAQDRAALLGAFAGLDTTRVLALSSWASLNNSDDDTGIADHVVLRESDGLLVERVPYSASGVPAGTPIEKRSGVWTRATTARGTPLAFPAERGSDEAVFALAPRRLGAGDREVQLAWSLPWPRGKVTVELYDLAGRRAARLIDEVASGPSDTRRVAMPALPPGLYVAVLRAHDGAASVTHQAALRVGGSRP